MNAVRGNHEDNWPMYEAEYWKAKLSGDDVQSADWLDFRAWINLAAENRMAYEKIERIWSYSGMLSEGLDLVAPSSDSSSIKPSFSWRIIKEGMWDSAITRVGAVAALVLVVLGGVLLSHNPASERLSTYATAVGEIRSISLADQTKVILNTATKIDVQYSSRQRKVVVGDGEAYFEVTQDPARPFRVIIGGDVIEVLGTKFNIHYDKVNSELTVLEGSVRFLSGVDGTLKVLSKGDRLLASDGRNATLSKISDLDAVTSWRNKVLVFENERLEVVVNEINRYFKSKLVIDGDELKDVKITGVFRVEDEAEISQMLELLTKAEIAPAGPHRKSMRLNDETTR